MTTGQSRPCWENCTGTEDREVAAIDALEDSLAPLDEQTIEIRRLITLFEACYHEADREAEFIAAAIGAGYCPERSNERPAQRRRELENAQQVLSAWCQNPAVRRIDQEVGGLRTDELLKSLGEPNPLKCWQVTRVVDRISHALDPNHFYYNLALNAGGCDTSATGVPAKPCQSDSAFWQRTRETILHDTVDGHPSQISLAYAIDLLMPCGWDFVGSLATILQAIGGNLHPQRPMACCARNVRLGPLCGRLQEISDTLHAFWTGETNTQAVDHKMLASLGVPTSVKRWLAASLDKTIRLHLTQPFDMDLL
jgi:hypothetical protein